MNVLVVGWSGSVGTELCCERVERGCDVTVLSRTPETEIEGDIRTVSGDVTEHDSVEPAFEGRNASHPPENVA